MTKREGDDRLYRWVHWALQWGFLTSMLLILAGLAWAAIRGSEAGPGANFSEITASLLSGNPRGLVSLGVLALLLTPVAAVAAAVFHFAAARDRLYAGISLLVLVVLGVGLALGLA